MGLQRANISYRQRNDVASKQERAKATLDDPITIFGFTFPKRSYFLLTVSVFFVIMLFVASSIPQNVSVKIRAGCYDINSDPCEPINVVFTDKNGNQIGQSAVLDDDGY